MIEEIHKKNLKIRVQVNIYKNKKENLDKQIENLKSKISVYKNKLEMISKEHVTKEFLLKAKEDKLIDLNDLIEKTMKNEDYKKIQNITEDTVISILNDKNYILYNLVNKIFQFIKNNNDEILKEYLSGKYISSDTMFGLQIEHNYIPKKKEAIIKSISHEISEFAIEASNDSMINSNI